MRIHAKSRKRRIIPPRVNSDALESQVCDGPLCTLGFDIPSVIAGTDRPCHGISGNVHVGTGCSAWLYSLRGAIGALPAVRLGVLRVTGFDDARHQPADGTVTR